MGIVYFVNGFLEAGKTSFISELIGKESFRIPGKTLIILCEEGDTEYDAAELAKANAVTEVLEAEEDFDEKHISDLCKKHSPDRIIVEFNGMWDRKNLEFSQSWDDMMEIVIFDASTFKLYADNMRSLLAEQVRNAELVIFNRADEVRDKIASYTRNIKAINNRAAFVFRGEDGDFVLDPDEDLPYDIDSDEIETDDVGFAVMCMDSMERLEQYEGKKISFKARAYKMKNGGDLEFIAGRLVMTCCEADMTFVGMVCGYQKAYELENEEWIEVKGIIRASYDEELDRDIPVCRVWEMTRNITPGSEFVSLI